MRYKNVIEAKFLSRPNRFIAQVEIDNTEHTVHVKNTGRCRELLRPGVTVYLSVSDNPQRKTKYDLIAVSKIRNDKAPLLVNMDSQTPNDAAEEWLRKGELFSKNAIIRREVRFGNSRFDFYIEDGDRKAYLEVKGVTQESNGTAKFPDAPTERGVKHIEELIACQDAGFEAYILFVIQMKEISQLMPNDETHPAFGEALRKARDSGVRILAMDCKIEPDSMTIDSPVPVVL